LHLPVHHTLLAGAAYLLCRLCAVNVPYRRHTVYLWVDCPIVTWWVLLGQPVCCTCSCELCRYPVMTCEATLQQRACDRLLAAPPLPVADLLLCL
jgi:hypothetical protein